MIEEGKWNFISETLTSMQIQSDRMTKASRAILLTPESPLCEPQAITESLLIKALSRLVGDHLDNIEWFVYECDFGRNAQEAGLKNNMKKINSHDQLRWLIELNCD